MKYQSLLLSIDQTHQTLQQSAVKAVNSHITLRNWLIGYYIVEFEQNGEDRAKYGSKLLKELAHGLKIKGLSAPELSRCRQFFNTYSLFIDFLNFLPAYDKIKNKITSNEIFGSLTQKSESLIESVVNKKMQHAEINLFAFLIF